jgi:two-component sensor histidine kinase
MQHFSSPLFLILLPLLTALTSTVQGQHTTVAQADSLKSLLREGKRDTSQVNILLRLSNYYGRKTWNAAQNRDSALAMARQANALSRQLHYARGREEAVFLEGKMLIRQENMGAVQGLLKTVSKENRVRLLLELGKQRWQDSHAQKADLDTSLALFHQAERLSESIKNQRWKEESHFLLGVIYQLKKDKPKAKSYFDQVIEARRRAGDKAGEATALMKTLLFVRYTSPSCIGSECTERLNAFNRALALSRQIRDKAREIIVLLQMGTHYLRQDNFKQADLLAHQALAIQKKIGYPTLNRSWHALTDETAYIPQNSYTDFSNAHFLLTSISEKRSDLGQTLLNYLQATRDIEQSGLFEELAYPYFLLGVTYYEAGKLNKGIEYYQKSLAVSHQKGEAVVMNGLIRWLADALLKQGKAREALQVLEEYTRQNLPLTYASKTLNISSLAKCYGALKQYRQAEKYYLEAIAMSEQSPDKQTNTTVKYAACQFYVATGQYRKAVPLIKWMMTYLDRSGGPGFAFQEAYLLQFKVDSALGNYPSAIRHYQVYTALKDSILNEAKSKQIEELGVRYETEKKEQALRLKEKDNALLREQNKAGQTQRNALLGGTLLLMSLLALIYNRYRLKQRSNQLLQAQQEKLQAQQQEIHHKNQHLSQLLLEKDSLLGQKDMLIGEKEGLLFEKDALLEEQQRLLAEKERLLKEIHHRVKNNLQVVMSLLNSQADSLQDKAALSAIQESQHRVQAMALIHQKLYQSEGVARIAMHDYIEEVVAYLHESYCLDQLVRFELQVEPIELDVTQAVPLGLIINEVITNAFKYAFPNGRPGTVTLRLLRLEESTYQLTIADDGVGLPAHYDPSQSRSLGMTLLHGFSGQLGGELTITSPPGLTIDLVFEEEQLSPSYAPVAQTQ